MTGLIRSGIISIFITLIFITLAHSQNAALKAHIINGVQRVDIVGGEYFFIPDSIEIKVNIPVELRVWKEKGFIPHNIVINAPEAGIKVRESLSSTPKIIRFTPYETGNFTFYCDKRLLFFKSHREKGMKGILRVVK